MGRRALRPIDPRLDLTGHFIPYDQLPSAGDFAVVFGRRGPVEVEAGSGKGLFLSSAAAHSPDADFLGLEISARYAKAAAARLARGALPNARVVHGDARRFFNEWAGNESLRAVHVYFPDPWWKARHKKRRIMNDEFIKAVERALVPGGRLHFWTDVEEYFHAGVATVREDSSLQGPLEVPEQPALHDLDYRTHFERRMRMHQEAVYRAEFVKPAAIA